MPDTLILGIRFEVWMVGLTIAISFASIAQFLIYCRMHRTTKIIERAYTGIKLVSPIAIHPDSNPSSFIAPHNAGKTPAQVVDAFVTCDVATTLPPVPNYTRPIGYEPASFVLMPDETFTWNAQLLRKISAAEHAAIHANAGGAVGTHLFVYGCIEYVDKFGGKHRTGFARRYEQNMNPVAGVPPFMFGVAGGPAYNYAD